MAGFRLLTIGCVIGIGVLLQLWFAMLIILIGIIIVTFIVPLIAFKIIDRIEAGVTGAYGKFQAGFDYAMYKEIMKSPIDALIKMLESSSGTDFQLADCIFKNLLNSNKGYEESADLKFISELFRTWYKKQIDSKNNDPARFEKINERIKSMLDFCFNSLQNESNEGYKNVAIILDDIIENTSNIKLKNALVNQMIYEPQLSIPQCSCANAQFHAT